MKKSDSTILLIYDGACPMCRAFGKAIKIREAVGDLQIINGREPHPILDEINQRGFSLDEGIVVKYNNQIYHGSDALHILALLSTNQTWFNRINAFLFRSTFLSKLSYPLLKNVRNSLLWYNNIPKINNIQTTKNQQPIFQPAFGAAWNNLPSVIQKHFANRPYSQDLVTIAGNMNIKSTGVMKFLFPLFRLLHILTPNEGDNIPVTVYLRSYQDSPALHFERVFYFPNKEPYHFKSYMLPIKDNVLVEFIFLGIGWKAACEFKNNKVELRQLGYVWKLFNFFIPLPLGLFMGKTHLEIIALSEDAFILQMEMTHRLFGNYSYTGEFKIVGN